MLLADDRRRAVLHYFTMRDTDVAELAEIVEHVYEKVTEITTLRHARLSLIQIHLPKLADFSVIDYDPQKHTVRYRGGTNLEVLLAVATRLEDTA
ncbi:DUF7344 domain-containing protein [Haladaptatus sp. NG-SE-30]